MANTGLSKARVEMYLSKFASSRVCVLGDVMLDRYFWGEVERISPEAPVPVVRVNRRSSRLGGAANVAANLCAVGVEAAVAGVIGDDPAGHELGELLEGLRIDTECLVVENARETTEKVRIIAQSQQVVRADFETESPLSESSKRRIVSNIIDGVDRFDALIVSDYGKGVVQEAHLREIIRAWKKHDKPVLVDPHVGHFKWYHGSTIVTPNTKEAASCYGVSLDREELLSSIGFRMIEELDLKALLVTRGEDGMSLFLDDQKQIHIPTVAKEVYDVTGAGDTVIGILAAGIASGAPLIDAVVVANQAAGEVVKEVGTSTITRDKLLNSFE
ncbi:MAG: D-glycero-beta-D-manno-heptose-7-phosphate kinase [Candidatus Latescibacterota bacterium]|nr:MAG: D-glycero-beta-D-manno-heptose-7-phosphate kinase [Candidatus Latescibacterota bacterium]